LDEAFKRGLADVIQADPREFDQNQLYSVLQNLTISYQLKEHITMVIRPTK